jgi:hypothetical protein
MKKKFTLPLASFFFLFCFLSAKAQFTAIGTYNWDGKPNYLITPGDTISANFRNSITATLPEYRSVPVYNPQLISDGKVETIGLACSSDIWITFVDEGAVYRNVLGYYTYPTNNPPTTAPQASQIKIIFPNASKSGFGGSLNPGDKVYLGNFPANTSIGFVLIADGWDGNAVTEGKWILYSNSKFNPENDTTLKKHTVMLHDSTSDRLIIGFEDIRRDGYGSDQDFNDVLFFATVIPYPCVTNTDSIPDLTPDGHFSISGNKGGLESKSLGNAVAKRIYNNAHQNVPSLIDYSITQKLSNNRISTFGIEANPLNLSNIMPSKILDSGIIAYITTPADITTISNAVDARSVDFTYNNQCRAVAFATKTLGQMYDHTKPICDRLKGAELIAIDNFVINALNFTRYTLKQPEGNIEYAMSFAIGKKIGRNSFSFQSNWLNDNYVAEDTMINYQVWGAAPYYCVDMVIDLLNKLNAIMPVQQLKPSAALPNIYIVSGKRNGTELVLNIKNKTNYSTGYLTVDDKLNENSLSTNSRTVPFAIAPNGSTNITLTVSDKYESAISLYINGKKEDAVFMADGAWNIDYNQANTTVTNFTISNDSTVAENKAGEYRLFRNAAINATTTDYVSAYKVLKGGGMPEDLSAYTTIKLSAAGANARLRIYLVKSSITNWSDQYNYTFPLTADQKEYAINLTDFTSSKFNEKINPNDITTVVFSFEVANNATTKVLGNISTVTFTKQSAEFYTNILSGQIILYPNPSNGMFNAGFNADTNMPAIIRITDAATGRTVLTKNITTIKGVNTVPIQITEPGTHVYLLSIEGTKKYTTTKIVVNK